MRDPEFEVLDKLIAAGLGYTPQEQISKAQFAAAMRGEKVKSGEMADREYYRQRLRDTPGRPSESRSRGQQIRYHGK